MPFKASFAGSGFKSAFDLAGVPSGFPSPFLWEKDLFGLQVHRANA